MLVSLKEINRLIGGKLIGDGNTIIKSVAPIESAKKGDITFCFSNRYLPHFHKTEASAVVISPSIPPNGKPVIITSKPYGALISLLKFLEKKEEKKGIHPKSVISENVELGEGVYVGPYAVVEKGAKIGKNSFISPYCYIGENVVLGEGVYLHPHVTIEKRVKIGNQVIIQSGTVVGSDGFGYHQEGKKMQKIPHLGNVIIKDEVEIGANTTIDRGTIGDTVIGEGTKIDNLVQIAHNVVIGKNCVIVAQVGISGSVKIGNGVILAGQVGVCDHLKIGDGVKVLARSVVTKDIPPNLTVSGFPARDHREEKKIKVSLAHLPELLKKFKRL